MEGAEIQLGETFGAGYFFTNAPSNSECYFGGIQDIMLKTVVETRTIYPIVVWIIQN